MNNLELSFDAAPWELLLEEAEDTVTALRLLNALEGAGEDEYEQAMELLEDRGIIPDISDLPKPPASGEAALRLRQEEQLVAKGLHPQALAEGDPLRLYLEEVAMTPAFGDEQLLAEEVLSGSSRAMEQLTNLSLSRVIELSQEYVGRGVLLMDLIQEGSLGLWQAIQNFSGGEFAPHRDQYIRLYLSRTVLTQARESGVGQKLRTALEDYRSVDERLLSELGRNPTLEEIAEAMHITVEAAATISKMVADARRLNQAKREPDPEEEKEAEAQTVEDTAYFQTRQRVNEMLSGLNAQEAKVISLRFGLEGGLPLSPEDTGRKLGMTPDEVVALETAAMQKMRRQ
ncbi:MAG: sigma-70 family RNA polymerase sigma factor [Oscillospiraceae bacterium]|nr:sigma-70 family RNA polymerase sigma factor [Oscillospiraceae bacterium]